MGLKMLERCKIKFPDFSPTMKWYFWPEHFLTRGKPEKAVIWTLQMSFYVLLHRSSKLLPLKGYYIY